MKISDFELYKDLLKDKSGLVIHPDQTYMLDSRLTPVAKKWGYPTLTGMTMALRGVPDTDLVKDVIEAMTINDTAFFRDETVFQALKGTILPYLQKNRSRKHTLRIWSAACSSGQEPYSIAMTLKENQDLLGKSSAEILATDLSYSMIETAMNAEYSQFESQRGLPVQLLIKYFDVDEDNNWRLQPDVKKMVKYKYFNLLKDMNSLGEFDVIFCCNVLEFFDKQTQADILERMIDIMPEDGFILLGENETVTGITDKLKPLEQYKGAYILTDGRYNFEEKAA